MNKELIDKNICEFMHWLREGNILAQEYCYDENKYSYENKELLKEVNENR